MQNQWEKRLALLQGYWQEKRKSATLNEENDEPAALRAVRTALSGDHLDCCCETFSDDDASFEQEMFIIADFC